MRQLGNAALVVSLVLVVVGGLAGSARSTTASTQQRDATSNSGFLERFAPRTARTWWAIVESNWGARTWVVRTTNSGRRWHVVTPPVKLVSSSAFLGRNVAWIEADALHPPRTEPVYRTLDGGRSWQRLGPVKSGCQLDFVDRRHGWCTVSGGAAGSASVWVYRTRDGGASWALVSRTAVPGQGVSTPGALPLGCDKTFGFTSPRIGWAALTCAGGDSPLYISTDGGARWHRLPAVRLPKGLGLGGGTEMGLPAVDDSHLALSLGVDSAAASGRGRTVVATSANRGRTWESRIAPAQPSYGSVDFIDIRHWVLSNGSMLLVTGDAGRHWRSLRATAGFVKALGTPLTPDFLSSQLGFAFRTAQPGPIWWTKNAGRTWERIRITAGPYILG